MSRFTQREEGGKGRRGEGEKGRRGEGFSICYFLFFIWLLKRIIQWQMAIQVANKIENRK
jgi:hypothetical protein